MQTSIASSHHAHDDRHRRSRPRGPEADPEEGGKEPRPDGLGPAGRSDLPLRSEEASARVLPLDLPAAARSRGSGRQGGGPCRGRCGPRPGLSQSLSYAIDVNVLLYASDAASPFSRKAIAFLEQCAAGPEVLCVGWPTLMSYLRLVTHPAVF